LQQSLLQEIRLVFYCAGQTSQVSGAACEVGYVIAMESDYVRGICLDWGLIDGGGDLWENGPFECLCLNHATQLNESDCALEYVLHCVSVS
jgi:hypothetical protein